MKSSLPGEMWPQAPYAGQRIALLTQHGKERVMASVLDAALGSQVELVTGYDTDQLGSFSREMPRAGTQIEAARKKARIGMKLSGLPLGLASEGAFGADPMVGMLPWNREIVLFMDEPRGLEIVGTAQGRAQHSHCLAADWAEAVAFAQQSGFPSHHLLLRPQSENDPRLRKDIANWGDFAAAFAWAQAESANGQVCIETDLRAHANPTRMQRIREASENLAAKLTSICPVCAAPGFWMVDRITGLPCSGCGVPTRETRAVVYGCLKCPHRVTQARNEPQSADPSRCHLCNP